MDINKEAEQVLNDIFMAEWNDIHPDFKKTYIDLILQSFERICREQREMDVAFERKDYKWLSDFPLLTDNK